MPDRRRATLTAALWAVFAICTGSSGCVHQQLVHPPDNALPHELDKASLPPYVIEPPDILMVDALRLVPLPPYHVAPLDALFLQLSGIDPTHPIDAGIYQIEPEGTINLGVFYGKIPVEGLTMDEIRLKIEQTLKDQGLKDARANVSLYQSRAFQQIRGEHLVRFDGTISLGTYGSVYVTGMTLEEARKAVEAQLANYLQKPEVSLDVLAYNSKVFYIIVDGAGNGEQVIKQPVTGNETVLDAFSNIGGLAAQASKKRIWIARPAPANAGCGTQILPIDWSAIVQCGKTETNYQIFPNDRIYVKAQPLITFNVMLDRLIAPAERAFGVTLLGQETIRSFERPHSNNTLGNNTTGTGF